MARHNREGQGADQRGSHYGICYQPDWLRHVKVTRDLETGRQSTKTLFRNPAKKSEGEPGDKIRTRVTRFLESMARLKRRSSSFWRTISPGAEAQSFHRNDRGASPSGGAFSVPAMMEDGVCGGGKSPFPRLRATACTCRVATSFPPRLYSTQ